MNANSTTGADGACPAAPAPSAAAGIRVTDAPSATPGRTADGDAAVAAPAAVDGATAARGHTSCAASRPVADAPGAELAPAAAGRSGPVVALVLAAGMSRRMGRLKPLLATPHGTVIQAVLDAVIPQVDRTLLVVGHRAAAVAAQIGPRSAQPVLNPRYALGMVTSVQAGMLAAPTAAAYTICLGDQPGVTGAVLQRLVQAWRGSGARLVVPQYGGRTGHPVLVDALLRAEVLELPADSGLNTVTRRHRHECLVVPVEDAEVLHDLDTPQDYQAFLARTGQRHG